MPVIFGSSMCLLGHAGVSQTLNVTAVESETNEDWSGMHCHWLEPLYLWRQERQPHRSWWWTRRELEHKVQVHFAQRGVSSHVPHQPFVFFLWWQQSSPEHWALMAMVRAKSHKGSNPPGSEGPHQLVCLLVAIPAGMLSLCQTVSLRWACSLFTSVCVSHT